MIPRARHLAAAALSSALLMLPALTGTAHAAAWNAHSATASAAAPTSKVYAVPLARTLADVKRVANYWKPDRLKKSDSYTPATPGAAAPVSTSGSAAAPATPVATVRRSLAAQSVLPVPPRKGAAMTMGKVFFRIGDKEYWCSASSIAAKNRSVVATAAHCAYDSRQAKPADYWIFVPNPDANGETPDGIYVGASISLHEDWIGKADYDYDYAFVTVNRGFTWVAKNGGYVMQDVGRLPGQRGRAGDRAEQEAGLVHGQALRLPGGGTARRHAPVRRQDAAGVPGAEHPLHRGSGARPAEGRRAPAVRLQPRRQRRPLGNRLRQEPQARQSERRQQPDLEQGRQGPLRRGVVALLRHHDR